MTREEIAQTDFDELRRKRDEAINKMFDVICAERGWDRAKVYVHVSPSGCYCDCAGGGPCEHEFGGWREFEGGRGGETFCSKCGTGSMSHDMWRDF